MDMKFTTIITEVGNFRYDEKDYNETLKDVNEAIKSGQPLKIVRVSPGTFGDKQVESNITTYLDVSKLDILGYEENIMTELKPKKKDLKAKK